MDTVRVKFYRLLSLCWLSPDRGDLRNGFLGCLSGDIWEQEDGDILKSAGLLQKKSLSIGSRDTSRVAITLAVWNVFVCDAVAGWRQYRTML